MTTNIISKEPSMSDVTVTVRMSSQQRDRLRKVAEMNNRSVSYLSKEAITRYIESEEYTANQIEMAVADIQAGVSGIPHENAVNQIRATIEHVSQSKI